MGATKSAALDESSFRERLAFEEPDFVPDAMLLSTDARAAIAMSADGAEAALAVSVGDRIALRRFRIGQPTVRRHGETLSVTTGEGAATKSLIVAESPELAENWRLRLCGDARRAEAEPL